MTPRTMSVVFFVKRILFRSTSSEASIVLQKNKGANICSLFSSSIHVARGLDWRRLKIESVDIISPPSTRLISSSSSAPVSPFPVDKSGFADRVSQARAAARPRGLKPFNCSVRRAGRAGRRRYAAAVVVNIISRCRFPKTDDWRRGDCAEDCRVAPDARRVRTASRSFQRRGAAAGAVNYLQPYSEWAGGGGLAGRCRPATNGVAPPDDVSGVACYRRGDEVLLRQRLSLE